MIPHSLYLGLGKDGHERCLAYRELFRPELDAEAATDIRQALQLGMPVGNHRFAEAICAQLGIRHNSGKRGRPDTVREAANLLPQMLGQKDFGF